MADKGEQSRTLDLFQCCMTRDRADVGNIVVTVNNMVNSFDYELDDLIHIASGLVANQDIQTGL